MKMYDLSSYEIENGELADLANNAGYASLKSLCNEQRLWGATVEDVKKNLIDQILSNQNEFTEEGKLT